MVRGRSWSPASPSSSAPSAGLDDVGSSDDTRNYLALAARAFFDNGGRASTSRGSSRSPVTRQRRHRPRRELRLARPLRRATRWRPGGRGGRARRADDQVRSPSSAARTSVVASPAAAPPLKACSPGAAVELVADRHRPDTRGHRPRPATSGSSSRDGRVLGYRKADGGFDPVHRREQAAVATSPCRSRSQWAIPGSTSTPGSSWRPRAPALGRTRVLQAEQPDGRAQPGLAGPGPARHGRPAATARPDAARR